MYASAAFVCEGSTEWTCPGFAKPDTSLHVRPLSRVTFTSPVLMPAQISPRATVEAPMDMIVPGIGSPGFGVAESGGTGKPAGYARFGLIFVQCAPPSVVDIRYWKPASSRCGSKGSNRSGASLLARSRSDGSCAGLTFTHCSLG